ncbi:hypothetical protein ASPSYDRAFT_33253 [Aspergillus sydowii CBS 593.65]|uniref:Cupin type-2 domain-containing protein n=1 Tax=Aspergillus sydowii CBS 593.65 TaxID=1036612 RepID=A0A1L9TCG4_9EURO|nr:uncharacterized protein ASPSYDRAFT_33253 [Aspergillus sydowii CBS 593.65]OJJ57120.1 hypothetical protein ASPSYDRAFT_33253 [Aspergillus sydowii CBS 593.65]
MTTRETLPNNLPLISRHITSHTPSGQTTFDNSTIPAPLPWQQLSNGARFSLAYATNTTPVPLTSNTDLTTYGNYLANLPGITIPGGTVLRIVDMNPGATSPMHRTISLDYGVVLEGEVELILDSGESRLLRRGDVAVQRGTNHAWRNVSERTWARMLYVLQEAEEVVVDGVRLGEDYGGGMDDVRASGRD